MANEAEPAEPEPSVDPQYLIKAVRSFVSVAQPGGAADASVEALPWEEAGSLIWDSSAMADDAAFLLHELPELPGMLAATLSAAAAADQWRAVEIGTGILGNLACHPASRQQVLEQEQLPELLLDQLLWVDDVAALVELLRALAAVVGQQANARWWVLLLRDEVLGRLVWIVENTLSSALLERALNLLAVMVGATSTVAPAGDLTKQQQMVPRLLSLDLLQLLASVLTGWLVRLHAEQQQFGGSSRGPGKRKRISPSPGGWGTCKEEGQGDGTGGGTGQQLDEEAELATDAVVSAAAGASPGPEAETPAELATSAVVAAQVSEAAALEALALLEVLAADAAGEQALNSSGPAQHALVRTIAESEHRDMQALSTVLLAGLDGAGVQLLQHPSAVNAVLGRLAEHTLMPGPGSGGDNVMSEQRAEEAEAGWALCSALAGAVSQRQGKAAALGGGEGQGKVLEAGMATHPHDHHVAQVDEVLGVMSEYVEVLCGDLGYGVGASLARHQAYVLDRLGPLLAERPSLGAEQRAALLAALERGRAPEHKG